MRIVHQRWDRLPRTELWSSVAICKSEGGPATGSHKVWGLSAVLHVHFFAMAVPLYSVPLMQAFPAHVIFFTIIGLDGWRHLFYLWQQLFPFIGPAAIARLETTRTTARLMVQHLQQLQGNLSRKGVVPIRGSMCRNELFVSSFFLETPTIADPQLHFPDDAFPL